jgi:signal transduction histidine kinase
MVRTFAATAAVAIEKSRLQESLRSVAVMHERERIGMDLHDGIIQSIYAIGLGLEAASDDVEAQPAKARGAIERSIEQLSDVIRDVRSYIFKLAPSRTTDDLVAALGDLVTEFRINSLIEASVEVSGDLPRLGPDQQETIYHVAQEALSNARRHARATNVSLSLASDDGVVRLVVSDNGCGFETAAEAAEEHRGLRNMRSRAQSVGGSLHVESADGRGTSIELAVPQEG